MKHFDAPALILFFVITLAGILQHSLLLNLIPELNERVFQAYVLGLGYDVMNGAIFGILALLAPIPVLARKIIFWFVGAAFLAFQFTDYNYVLLFGTHLPFSSNEYLLSGGVFWSSAFHAVKSFTFWLLFILPSLLLGLLFWYPFNNIVSLKIELLRRIFSLIFLLVLGGAAASYSNSYVSKNMENPLTSAALQYFYYSKDREPNEIIERPQKSLKIVKELLTGRVPVDEQWRYYPLVRIREAQGCSRQSSSEIAKTLCQTTEKPNILILLLESFRAAEVGVYGSKLGLTPEFDRWSNYGVLFKNFYANGFQTRHGLVATYCSLFPNYGAAVLKRYTANSFMCLPEILKNRGYSNSWVYASDANFDGQSTFLPKIGFEKIVDEFDYSDSAKILGWGLADEELYRKWEEMLDTERQPFFSSALTITNHHPFEVPEEYKLHRGNLLKDRYREALYYTDAMLGKFLTNISKKSWFKNTVIFITADTSSFQPPEQAPKDFEELVKLRSQVPLLIISGASYNKAKKSPGLVINLPASQVDLAPTVLDLLAQQYTAPWVGNSLLSHVTKNRLNQSSRAFTNRPGAYWGVIEEKTRYYQENNKLDHYFGNQTIERGRALKVLGSAWHKVIRWVLQENLVWPQKIK